MQPVICPECNAGFLLPMSQNTSPYAYWVCSSKECRYTISQSLTGVTYYKGFASCEEKSKGTKEWREMSL